MSTPLAAIPGYGLTEDLISQTERIVQEVRQRLTEFLGVSVTTKLFSSGKFRVAAHFDALPSQVKRLRGNSTLRYSAYPDPEEGKDVVWIDGDLRDSPQFAAEVTATAAFCHDFPLDRLLEGQLAQHLDVLIKQDEHSQAPGLKQLLGDLVFLRGQCTFHAPYWQQTHLWLLAVVLLARRRCAHPAVSNKSNGKSTAARWMANPRQPERLLKKAFSDLHFVSELAFLRVQCWANQKIPPTCLIDELPRFLDDKDNPYLPAGEPLATRTTLAVDEAFPTLSDWATPDFSARGLPHFTTGFTGPLTAWASYGEKDSLPTEISPNRPLASIDVRPGARLLLQSEHPWEESEKASLFVVQSVLFSPAEREGSAGAVFPFIRHGRETVLEVQSACVSKRLTEAFCTLRVMTDEGKEPVCLRAYAAHWAHNAAKLRVNTPYTAEISFWGTSVKKVRTAPRLWTNHPLHDVPGAKAVLEVVDVQPLGTAFAKNYVILAVTWSKKALHNVPLILPADLAQDVVPGDRLLVVGLFLTGAFYRHTTVTSREQLREQLPLPRQAVKKLFPQGIAATRRFWRLHPNDYHRVSYIATTRLRHPLDQVKQLHALAEINTPASIALTFMHCLQRSDVEKVRLPLLHSAGMLAASGFVPLLGVLLNPDVSAKLGFTDVSLFDRLFQCLLLQDDHPLLKSMLGQAYLKKASDPHQALLCAHWFMTSAAQGSVSGILGLAQCLACGIGVTKNLTMATELLMDLQHKEERTELFYLAFMINLMGESFYETGPNEHLNILLENVRQNGNTVDWIMLIVHLLHEQFMSQKNKKALLAAHRLAMWLHQRTHISMVNPLLKNIQSLLTREDEKAACQFDVWQWLKLKAPEDPLRFEDLINPMSDLLLPCLQSETFFNTLTQGMVRPQEHASIQFIHQHLVRMAPGISRSAPHPSENGLTLSAYLGIADTSNFAGNLPALACVQTSGNTVPAKAFYFPFLPEGCALKARLEEAFSTANQYAGFLRMEIQDSTGFPCKSLIVFDTLWATAHAVYEPLTHYNIQLCGLVEHLVDDDASTDSPADSFQEALGKDHPTAIYLVHGRLETVEEDYVDIAGVMMSRLWVSVRMGMQPVSHFPLYMPKKQLLEDCHQELPRIGMQIHAALNLHGLILGRDESLSYATHSLQ